MAVTEKRYPEWVQKQRTRGTTVKKKGDSYYLYKRTSRRVEGKKYPQPVDTYIGIITPEGVVRTNRKRVDLTEIAVYEYGYSKAVWELCPEGWKKPLGDDWEEVLRIILAKESPETYLCMERPAEKETDYHYQFPVQAASLSRRLYKEYGVSLEELKELKGIYLVVAGKEKAVSRINQKQAALISRLGIDMGEW